MKLTDLTLEERKTWNNKYKRFQRAWLKKNNPEGKPFKTQPIFEAFCKKHNIEV